MQKVFEGDEWKHAQEPTAPTGMTRAQAQEHIDDLRLTGRIDREQWSERFDQLSNPECVDFEAVAKS